MSILKKVFTGRVKIILLICFFSIIFLVFIVHPIIASFFRIGPKVTDINEYINKTYLKHEGGKVVEKFFPEYRNINNYESISYYYINNNWRNSIIYGKILDVFALDIKYYPAYYDKEKNKLIDGLSEKFELGYYSINIVKSLNDGDYYDVCCICFDDKASIIRYMVVNDWGDDGVDRANLGTAIIRNSSLNWFDK